MVGVSTKDGMKRRHLGESMKKRVGAAQEWRCAHCAKLLPATFQVDHVKPHAIGGSDHPSNLEALCVECHASKSQTENARIAHHKKLLIHCENSNSAKPCWTCHRVISTYFTHHCDNLGEDGLYE
jgi:5-methylcytosine-specific restriction endonuclease McrA